MSSVMPAGNHTTNATGPVRGRDRIIIVDILRGFAIFGILVANMAAYSGQTRDVHAYESINYILVILTRFLIEAKFYSLFAFLFGWGMMNMVMRSETSARRFVPIYLRRMLVLLLFGLVHGLLIWRGDILSLYAVCGVWLLCFRRASGRVLLLGVVLSLLLSIVLTLPGEFMTGVRSTYNEATAFLRQTSVPESNLLSSNYLDVTHRRVQDFLEANSWFLYYVGNVFSMMLLGMYVAKRRIFHDVEQHLSWVRQVWWVGLVLGLIFNAIFVATTFWPDLTPERFRQFIAVTSRTIGAPALMLFYVTSLIMLHRRADYRDRLESLAPVGRASLSNYLLQSIVATLIFYGYGLSLYGRVGPTFTLALAVIIFVLQVKGSRWWLSRYRFGPAEWLWRTLTYMRWQPLRRQGALPGTAATMSRSPWRSLWLFALIWLLVLVWAGALHVWQGHIQGPQQGQYDLSQIGLQNVPTPATAEGNVDIQNQAEVQPVSMPAPVARPLDGQPDPLVVTQNWNQLAATFNGQEALRVERELSGQHFAGRQSGTPGGHAAAEFLGEQFAGLGLQPAGIDGTFFQPFSIAPTSFTATPDLTITTSEGVMDGEFKLYEDMVPLAAGYMGRGEGEGQVVWLHDCELASFQQVDVLDHIILCWDRDRLQASRYALEYGASGLLLLHDETQEPPDLGAVPLAAWLPEPIPTFSIGTEVAKALLVGSGKSVAELTLQYAPLLLESRARLHIETDDLSCENGCQGRNVLGILPGRDETLGAEIVIVGAAYDGAGQGVDGMVVPGATDNASGVVLMLELARQWQEQGYVPQQSILFAAWDGSRVDDLGYRVYQRSPRYPWDQTEAIITLQATGNGDVWYAEGQEDLVDLAQAVASAQGLAVEGEGRRYGRGDGPPALTLGWGDGQDAISPAGNEDDRPEWITAARLQQAGIVIDLTLLSYLEMEASLNDLLADRADAIMAENADAFLRTSTSEQAVSDREWYTDVLSFDPITIEMHPMRARLLGDVATAVVEMEMVYPRQDDEESTLRTSVFLDTRFRHTGEGWRWDGPVRQSATTGLEGVRVQYHPESQISAAQASDLATMIGQEYITWTNRLALPPGGTFDLEIFPNPESLRAATALSLGGNTRLWVGAGQVKLVDDLEMDASVVNRMVAGLILSDLGIQGDDVPWLWQALPSLMDNLREPVSIQSRYLPALASAFEDGDGEEHESIAWARGAWLVETLDWQGLGSFLKRLGQACTAGACKDEDGRSLAIDQALEMPAGGFEESWTAAWRQRLQTMGRRLDKVLMARQLAVMAGDAEAFLATVDEGIPGLLEEQSAWFADFERSQSSSFVTTYRPLAFLEEDGLVAEIVAELEMADESGNLNTTQMRFPILFTVEGSDYRWAGTPFLSSPNRQVFYPPGYEEVAQDLGDVVDQVYPAILARLGVTATLTPTLKLYENEDAFTFSVAPTLQAKPWVLAWSGADQSLKLQVQPGLTADVYRSPLVMQLIRHALQNMGVRAEWILQGLSAYMARAYDRGAVEALAAAELDALVRAQRDEDLVSLSAISRADQIAGEDFRMALAYSWDTMRYLIGEYGWDALEQVLAADAAGESLDLALQAVLGQGEVDFIEGWADSLVVAHGKPDWKDIANAFDGERAYDHVTRLTQEDLAGRQAGSPSSATTAAYIAQAYAAYGLLPLGDEGTYFQSFPMTYTNLVATPALEIGATDLGSLTYRRDFLLRLTARDGWGEGEGELVWIHGDLPENLDLTGKIALRPAADATAEELAYLQASGAAGIILAGRIESNKDMLAKEPYPQITVAETETIPIVELTLDGYSRLLQATDLTPPDLANAPPVLPLGVLARLSVPLSPPQSVSGANVLGLIQGSDPLLAEELVILGAHYDHVGDDPDGRRYSGANDDASGIAVLLEIARLWQQSGYRPGRSVLFAAWDGQEPGQLGSSYYVEHPPIPLFDTIMMFQMDAVGGGSGYYLEVQGSREREGLAIFGFEASEKETNSRLKLSVPIETTSIPDMEIYVSPFDSIAEQLLRVAKSDQVPFLTQGVPATLIYWRGANEENWPDEIADEVEADRLAMTGRMVTYTAMTIAR